LECGRRIVLDSIEPLWYNDTMNTDPDSFSFRLTRTIESLKAETAAGVEDWTPLISRLQEVLAEEVEAGR